MGETVKGIVHVHSHFSRDGLCSIADLAGFARESGFQFVGLTDHAEDLTPEDMKSMRRQCEKHSDESCVIIPGLEFRCSRDIHILGLGVTNDILSVDPTTVAREIVALGGLAILAHPGQSGYQYPAGLCRALDGIEIWNAAYDGRFVPTLAGLCLLRKAREHNPVIFGFGGADLHGLDRPPGVILYLRVNGTCPVDAQTVLDFLRSGRFTLRGTYVSLDAHAGRHPLARFRLWAFRKIYEVARGIRNTTLGRT